MMIRLIFSMVLLVIMSQPAFALVHGWRNTSVVPGGVVYFMFPNGQASEAQPTLPAGWTYFAPAFYSTGQSWQTQWAWGIKVSSAATPNTYNISTAGDGTLNVTVVAAPAARSWRTVSPRHVSRIQTYLDAGFDVELLRGRYEIGTAITVPNGARIRGSQSELVRVAGTGNDMFIPAGAFRLDGVVLTFDEDAFTATDIYYLTPGGGHSGYITIKDCTLKRGRLFEATPGPGCLIERCRFERAQCGINGTTIVRDCDFIGPSDFGDHAFVYAGSGIGVFSCRWQATARGIVCQDGNANGSVFMDLHFRDIRGSENNAGECILLESGDASPITPGPSAGARDHAFVDVWIEDCSGPAVQLFGSGMSSNEFRQINAEVDSDSVVVTIAGAGVTIGANTFSNFETNGRIKLIGSVGGQVFENFQIYETIQLKANDAGPFTATYVAKNSNTDYPIHTDATALALTYTFTGCNFIDMDRQVNTITDETFVEP